MENLINSLKESTFVWALLSVCTIIAIPALIISIRSRNKKEISFMFISHRIVKRGVSQVKRLTMLFDGESIEDLSVTRFTIWNSGNNALKVDDIAKDLPLRIRAGGNATILDAELVAESEKTNNFKISSCSPTGINLDFEFFDPKDGIVVQIIHTGDYEELNAECKIIGGKPLKCINSTKKQNGNKSKTGKEKRKLMLILLGIEVALMAFLSFFSMLKAFGAVEVGSWYYYPFISNEAFEKFSSVLFLALTMLTLIPVYLFTLYRYFNLRIPQKLRKESCSTSFEQ